MITVRLTWSEQLTAAHVGAMRRIGAMASGRPEPYGTPADLWAVDIEAAAAELAVAKAVGLFWPMATRPDRNLAGDVGPFQVRHTTRENGRLILHDRDSDDAAFVLVRGSIPSFDVVGWIWGADGKDQRFRFKGDGRPAFFVPETDLVSIHATSDLPTSRTERSLKHNGKAQTEKLA